MGLWFGALALLVPAYGLFNATNLSQQEFMASQTEENRISWALSEVESVDPAVALARANTCSVAGNKVGDQWFFAETVFDRDFSFDAENAAFHEGRFFCGLDGSIIQLANGKPKDPVQVLPEDMEEFHQLLVERHNVPVDQILEFKEKNLEGNLKDHE